MRFGQWQPRARSQVKAQPERSRQSSQPEGFHLRLLPEPCLNLSIHTAPDVQPPSFTKRQCAKSVG